MSRTIVDIDDEMLRKAQEYTGLNKKVEVVNYALRKLVEQKEIERILELRGKVRWEGDLEELRRGRGGAG